MAYLKPALLNELFGFNHTDRNTLRLIKRLNNRNFMPDEQLTQDELLELYDKAAEAVELKLSETGYPDELLNQHQLLFQEMESQLQLAGPDDRYNFIVVIPIADRPQHLKNCLASLLELCRRFNYGGQTNNHYQKISVLIADDSKNEQNSHIIKQTAEEYDRLGLISIYFGAQEQLNQIDKLDADHKKHHARILGDHPRSAFYHKGASITRNICYLKLNEVIKNNHKSLIWFIDSDQEFRVNPGRDNRSIYAINYFHRIERIFSKTKTQVLTGKVVGDPPVSPAVMGGNFLQDVLGFLNKVTQLDPHHSCEFHKQHSSPTDDAAYHDMADLFGFKNRRSHFNYRCTLEEKHTNKDCFSDFAAKLNAFFDGQHPTRETSYEYIPLDSNITPARTVYTGNYIINSDALDYFIPFATLSLRMAGPVLGRILKSELDSAFISANLPMLHKRTLHETNKSECRPGVNRVENSVDLSGECERQFFGDVMLFTIQKLTESGYPKTQTGNDLIEQTIDLVSRELEEKYSSTQDHIDISIKNLKTLVDQPDSWWKREMDLSQALIELNDFISNMEHNFGKESLCYKLINDTKHRQSRCNQIRDAIINYPSDRNTWIRTLGKAP